METFTLKRTGFSPLRFTGRVFWEVTLHGTPTSRCVRLYITIHSKVVLECITPGGSGHGRVHSVSLHETIEEAVDDLAFHPLVDTLLYNRVMDDLENSRRRPL